jgi:hypothetical protein
MKSGLGYLSRKRRGSVVGASTGLIILHCNELRSGKCGNLQHPGRRRAYRILQGDCLAVVLTWAIGRRCGRNQLVRTITWKLIAQRTGGYSGGDSSRDSTRVGSYHSLLG